MTDTPSCYINGIGIIAPQKTFENEHFLSEISTANENILSSRTPEFKAYINPIQLRRLSRMLRIGLTSSIISLRDANVQIPDGIITATGYGFLEETEKFLTELLERQEKQLTPTYFMQGTYNALAGLVALSVKCMGYNNTYVSKGFAFENALLDAMVQLSEHTHTNFLVGAYDEAAKVQHKTGLREGHYKTEYIDSLQLFESNTDGTIQGEGSAFFTLSHTSSATTWCSIKDIETLYVPENQDALDSALMNFLERNKIKLTDIDVWINGASGDVTRDTLMRGLEHSLLESIPQVRFKHLCGEYCTAVSFGLWIGASMLKKQTIPDVIKVNDTLPGKIETVLLINHYLNRNYSFLLLRLG